MVKLEAVRHPKEAELVWTMLNHAAAQLARQPSAAARDDSAEAKVAPSAPPSIVLPCPVPRAPCPPVRRGHRCLHDRQFRGIAPCVGCGAGEAAL
jgi:hypothetical protein